jgi:ubiquinone/menaquinone biosynthesis C-methylase UbiE
MDGDVTSLPFEDRLFDAVVSNFVIHNIQSKEQRGRAVEQMWRVLKPEGTLVISDIAKIDEYTTILEGKQTIGEVEVRKVRYTYPFSKIVVARKRV